MKGSIYLDLFFLAFFAARFGGSVAWEGRIRWWAVVWAAASVAFAIIVIGKFAQLETP